MDPVSVPISDDVRKTIYDDLAEAMLNAVEKGDMTYEEGQTSAAFILEKLDRVTNSQELLLFLHDLASKWKPYEVELTKINSERQQQDDATKITDIEENLNQLSQP